MKRQELIDELKANNVKFTKLRFYKVSPYQKKLYKPEYVGWEAWIYTTTSPYGHGALITQENWENTEYRQQILRDGV